MALSTLQTSQIFQALGLPEPAAGVAAVVHELYEPSSSMASAFIDHVTDGSVAQAVAKVTAGIARVNSVADQITLVGNILTQWYALELGSPMLLSEGNPQSRTIHHERQRKNLHRDLCNALGVWVPFGGFAGEVERSKRGSLLGDR